MKVDLDKMTDRVVEKALDEFTYNGKTLREWIEIIVVQKSLAIDEFEKLKKEIEKDDIYEWGRFKMLYRRSILEIIDKHIAELKGEQIMKDEQTEALKQFNDIQSKIVAEAEYVRKSNIAELEKVKENIQFLAEKCLPNSLAEEFEVKGLKMSIEIIDFHIAKLKGENNDLAKQKE